MSLTNAAGSVLAVCAFLAGCGSKETPVALQTGAGGGAASSTGGSSASAGAAGMGAAPAGACTVTFTFTPVDNHGLYSPSNVSAVWVTDSQGAFVKTLQENGYIRASHLAAWESQTKGNTVDAVTGATNFGFRAHTASWNCSDVSGNEVPDGSYTMHAEFTTSNTGGFFGGPAPLLDVPFDVGGSAYTLNPPDQTLFVGIELSYQ